MTIRTRPTAWLAATLFACAAVSHLSANPAAPRSAAAAESVKVKVTYTGQGNVDQTHQLWIWLFDTPDIGPGAMPVAQLSLAQNGGAVTFSEVGAAKVWIAAAYDEKGGSTGEGPPASGSPIGVYTTGTPAPAPVTPGAPGEVLLTFNDSLRMP